MHRIERLKAEFADTLTQVMTNLSMETENKKLAALEEKKIVTNMLPIKTDEECIAFEEKLLLTNKFRLIVVSALNLLRFILFSLLLTYAVFKKTCLFTKGPKSSFY